VKTDTKAPVGKLDIWDAGNDPGKIPPRQWLYANQFCKALLSALIGPGGIGKSALRLVQYISMALGKAMLGEHVFHRSRVLLISLEDDKNELQRRIAAALQHHKIKREELKGWLLCVTVNMTKIAEREKYDRIVGPLERQIRKAITEFKPDLVALDPFAKSHSLSESDNDDMNFVCDVLLRLAIEYKIAVDFTHHVHKGLIEPGDADAGRGASSIRDAARLFYTLTAMSEKEAEIFGVNPDERKSYLRLDSAKVNIVKTAPTAWFRLASVELGNITKAYPNGDNVQVAERWHPPDIWAGLDTELILQEIDRGLPDGNLYTDSNSESDRNAWLVIKKHAPNRSREQCREVIKSWMKRGVLVKQLYTNPNTRKEVKGLKIDRSRELRR
jgi:hypothetical protein